MLILFVCATELYQLYQEVQLCEDHRCPSCGGRKASHVSSCAECEDVNGTVSLSGGESRRVALVASRPLSDVGESTSHHVTANEDVLRKLEDMFPKVDRKLLVRQLRRAGNDLEMAMSLVTRSNHRKPEGM